MRYGFQIPMGSAILAFAPLCGQVPGNANNPRKEFSIEPIRTVTPAKESLPGEYFNFQGVGNAKRLNLMRDGTYAITHSGCLGPYGLAYGTWNLGAGVIRLTPTHETPSIRNSPHLLYIVQREGRTCFVPDSAINYFKDHGTCFFTAFCPMDWDLFGPPERN